MYLTTHDTDANPLKFASLGFQAISAPAATMDATTLSDFSVADKKTSVLHEIRDLKTLVSAYERRVYELKSHQYFAHDLCDWEAQAKRELAARLEAERRNVLLYNQLDRQLTATSQVIELWTDRSEKVDASSSLNFSLPAFDTPRVVITESNNTAGTLVIEIEIAWQFLGALAVDVEAAMWSLLHRRRWESSSAILVFDIYSSDSESVHGVFRLRVHPKSIFRGALIAERSRDPETGDLQIRLRAQTLPDGRRRDSVFNATMLEEEMNFRFTVMGSEDGSALSFFRKSHVYAEDVSPELRREVAEGVGGYFIKELGWLRHELEYLLTKQQGSAAAECS